MVVQNDFRMKGAIIDEEKLFALMGCSLLSILVLAGCNKKVQNPPPPADNNGVIHNNDGNGVNNKNGVGAGHNDINTHNDGNPAVDQNTREKMLSKKG